jgi:hypothetical protein
MCKTNVKIDLYFANIRKHEHGKNMIRLWCKIMPKTGVKHIKGNVKGLTSIYTPLGT